MTKANNPVAKMDKAMIRHFIEKEIPEANTYIKKNNKVYG